MTTVEDITLIVHRVIEEAGGECAQLSATTPLLAGGHLDSLTMLQLFMTLQSDLGIELDVTDVTEEHFGSIEAITELINERKAG